MDTLAVKWSAMDRLLGHSGPFAGSDFVTDDDDSVKQFIRCECRVLVQPEPAVSVSRAGHGAEQGGGGCAGAATAGAELSRAGAPRRFDHADAGVLSAVSRGGGRARFDRGAPLAQCHVGESGAVRARRRDARPVHRARSRRSARRARPGTGAVGVRTRRRAGRGVRYRRRHLRAHAGRVARRGASGGVHQCDDRLGVRVGGAQVGHAPGTPAERLDGVQWRTRCVRVPVRQRATTGLRGVRASGALAPPLAALRHAE
eukprot:ctg_601.g170